jgi:hypothetical protein
VKRGRKRWHLYTDGLPVPVGKRFCRTVGPKRKFSGGSPDARFRRFHDVVVSVKGSGHRRC